MLKSEFHFPDSIRAKQKSVENGRGLPSFHSPLETVDADRIQPWRWIGQLLARAALGVAWPPT